MDLPFNSEKKPKILLCYEIVKIQKILFELDKIRNNFRLLKMVVGILHTYTSENISKKIKSFAHGEFNTTEVIEKNIKAKIESGKRYF